MLERRPDRVRRYRLTELLGRGGASFLLFVGVGLVASCWAREPAADVVAAPEQVTPAAGGGCLLEPVLVEKAAAQPFGDAWTPSTSGGWMAWSDYRLREAGLPDAFARRYEPDTGDILLGASQGPTAVLARDRSAVFARIDRDHRVVVQDIRDGAAHELVTLGRDGFLPMLAASGDVIAIAWLESRRSPSLMISTRTPAGLVSEPLLVSQPPFAIRARLVAVPDGFALAWTQHERTISFARIGVDPTGRPSITWSATLHSQGAGEWPAIDVEELGELGLVDDVLHLPLLKATCPSCSVDTHVLRVRLDGTVMPHVVLAAAPFFAAVVNDDGFALSSVDDATRDVCVRRFTLDGEPSGAPSCIASPSLPQVPTPEDGYAAINDMRSSATWVGDELHVATLDIDEGTVFATRRVFRCRREQELG